MLYNENTILQFSIKIFDFNYLFCHVLDTYKRIRPESMGVGGSNDMNTFFYIISKSMRK